jgi:hypothetical protein
LSYPYEVQGLLWHSGKGCLHKVLYPNPLCVSHPVLAFYVRNLDISSLQNVSGSNLGDSLICVRTGTLLHLAPVKFKFCHMSFTVKLHLTKSKWKKNIYFLSLYYCNTIINLYKDLTAAVVYTGARKTCLRKKKRGSYIVLQYNILR